MASVASRDDVRWDLSEQEVAQYEGVLQRMYRELTETPALADCCFLVDWQDDAVTLVYAKNRRPGTREEFARRLDEMLSLIRRRLLSAWDE